MIRINEGSVVKKVMFLSILCSSALTTSVDKDDLSPLYKELRETEKKVEQLLESIAAQRAKIAHARKSKGSR